jgi:hypothetical protein
MHLQLVGVGESVTVSFVMDFLCEDSSSVILNFENHVTNCG